MNLTWARKSGLIYFKLLSWSWRCYDCTPWNRALEVPIDRETEERLIEKAKKSGLLQATYIQHLAIDEAFADADAVSIGVRKMTTWSPEQVQADREEIFKTARRDHLLPEGKTLSDVVEGMWPGDETDEQIYEMLERLS